MFKKIIIVLILSTFLISAVQAVDQTDFNVSDKFNDIGDGVYVIYDSSNNADEILSVVKYNLHDWDDYITNDTKNNYTVFKDANNTYNYTDGSVNEKGSFELIKVGSDKFIIDFSKVGLDDNFKETDDNLMEFNKLNTVTVVEK